MPHSIDEWSPFRAASVLSQMGTMMVHRLTNNSDREIVEKASGDIDRAARFLPTLAPGEAILIGTDFAFPVSVKIMAPTYEPDSRQSKTLVFHETKRNEGPGSRVQSWGRSISALVPEEDPTNCATLSVKPDAPTYAIRGNSEKPLRPTLYTSR
jgi:hypothetical protein